MIEITPLYAQGQPVIELTASETGGAVAARVAAQEARNAAAAAQANREQAESESSAAAVSASTAAAQASIATTKAGEADSSAAAAAASAGTADSKAGLAAAFANDASQFSNAAMLAAVEASESASAAAASQQDIHANWQDKLDAAAAHASTAMTQAGIATEKADVSITQAGLATTAKTAAEAARDAAQLSAGVYATIAAGLAATTSGKYFSVPSSSSYEHLILYQNNAGAALEVKRYPSSAMLTTPPWVGKTSAWPDPFFRKLSAISDVTNFLGKNRWWGGTTGFSLVTNSVYSGKALRRAAENNASPLNGPALYFSEVGAVAGDSVTIRMAFVGTAAVSVYSRQRDAAGVYVSNQVLHANTGALDATTPTIVTLNVVMVANAVTVEFYFAHASNTTSYDIVAIWGGKGAADTVPPTPAELPEVQSWDSVQARLTAINASVATTAGAAVSGVTMPMAAQINLNATYAEPRLRNVLKAASAAMIHGSYTSDKAFNSTFSGWDCPFIYNGTKFNVARVYVCIEATADVTFTISSSTRVVLASTTRKLYKSGWYFIPFEKTFNGSDTTNNVYYLGFTAKNAARMLQPIGSWPATKPDLGVYGVYYTTTASNGSWVLVSGSSAAYPSVFELHDIANASTEITITDDISSAKIEEVTALDVKRAVYGVVDVSNVIQYDTKTTVQTGTAAGSVRSDPFAGWGATYNREAGKSFNMVRLPSSQRSINAADATQKWATVVLEVRSGGPTGDILATSTVKVDPELNTLTNVEFLLKDPVTRSVITLSDANLPATYSIVFIAYNASGTKAVAGDPKGAMSHFAGSSYYITRTSATWSTYSGNPSLVFDTFLLTNPAIVDSYAIKPSNVPAANTARATELIAADSVYAVNGIESPLYFDNITLTRASEFHWDVTCSVGQQQQERFVVTSGTEGTYSLTVAATDPVTNTQSASKTLTLKMAASTAGTGLTKSVLVIGDSLVNAGTITQTLLNWSDTDTMKATLLGTRGSALNRHEGRGGWTVNDYATAGRTYYSFAVSGVVTPPAINSTKYSNNGAVYTVQEATLSGGAGTLVMSVDSGGAPTPSGTLTKTSGTGDASITFSASQAVSGNPFWFSGAVNFGQYLTNNGYTAPDWVLIALGINDVFGQTTDSGAISTADVAFAKLDALIASIKAAGASTKVGLMIPTLPAASQDAFGANYTTGQTNWRNRRNVLLWGKQLITKYSGQEASRVYVVPSNVALDTVNNYPRSAAAPVNARNSAITVQRQSNGVHPDTSGYQQIGDAVWAFLKYHT